MAPATNPDSDSKSSLSRRRQLLLDELAASVDRDFNDNRYDWLRAPGRRKGLVVFALLTPVVVGFANFFDQPVIAVIAVLAMLAFGTSWFLLKRTTRNIVDLPDDLVDERMLARRGEVYRYAYLGTATAISLIPTLLVFNELAVKLWAFTPLNADKTLDIVLPTMFFTYLLPTAIFAWTEREI